ncbi:MAG: hypothetical protein ACE5WD_11630 [Candidatus Aminicenantia bacterium]
MIQQTIDLLFEEESGEMLILDGIFNALWVLAQEFQVPLTEIARIIFETQERKKIKKGVIAARLMELIRASREGKPLSGAIEDSSVF